MLTISDDDLINRMRFDNPWWGTGAVPDDIAAMPERDYFEPFLTLVRERDPRRAVVLMGPRRVGKTIMMQQAIKRLLAVGAEKQNLLFLSVDTPLYSGLPLEKLLRVYLDSYGGAPGEKTVFFDEIQYLKDWEVHLKSLVDSFRDIKFVVSGSAAAALSRGSKESGAGRFTEFLLPPLTFAEFLRLTGHPLAAVFDEEALAARIGELNAAFIDYLNFGGYPELALSKEAQKNPARYIGQDIVEKVLLRDLPSLYGISDVQELTHLFKVLAFNTGQEVSLEGLSKSSRVAKNTLKRYIEYLEAAFLIRTVERIDMNAQRFLRNTSFKVYLTNPSLRVGLFGPVIDGDEIMGAMVETAVFAQWFHDPAAMSHIHYARARDGREEVDLVSLDADQRADWAVEVKWSDRSFETPSLLKGFRDFSEKNHLGVEVTIPAAGQISVSSAVCSTKTKRGRMLISGIVIDFFPSAIYSLIVGRNTSAEARRRMTMPAALDEDDGQVELPL